MFCEVCGKRMITCTHHLVFGNGLRDLADEDSLTLKTCDYCHTIGEVKSRIHDNIAAERLSKMLGQMMYERDRCAEGKSKDEARAMFMKRYGRSFL